MPPVWRPTADPGLLEEVSLAISRKVRLAALLAALGATALAAASVWQTGEPVETAADWHLIAGRLCDPGPPATAPRFVLSGAPDTEAMRLAIERALPVPPSRPGGEIRVELAVTWLDEPGLLSGMGTADVALRLDQRLPGCAGSAVVRGQVGIDQGSRGRVAVARAHVARLVAAQLETGGRPRRLIGNRPPGPLSGGPSLSGPEMARGPEGLTPSSPSTSSPRPDR